jgi:hypothetical protein
MIQGGSMSRFTPVRAVLLASFTTLIFVATTAHAQEEMTEETSPTTAPSAPTTPRTTPPTRRGHRAPSRQPASEDSGGDFGLHHATFDLGASLGSVNDVHYTEANLGLNLYFYEWLAWRNALFGRFASGEETIWGLDSSVRGVLNLGGGALGLTAFAGPGYRFINKGDNAPLVEAGIVFRLAGIALGGGAKTIINSAVRDGAPNDTQYFLILAGGGSL